MRITVRQSIPERRTHGGVARPCPAAHPIAVAARLSAILALGLVVLVVGATPTHTVLAAGARSPRLLTLADFTDQQGAQDVSDTADGTVSGVRYAHAISLGIHAAAITLFTHRYSGYAELALDIGIADSANSDRRSTLVVTADGKPADATPASVIVKSYGQAVTHVVVRFGKADTITLAADPDGTQGIEDLVVANPTLLPAGPARVLGSRVLTFDDFADRQGAQNVSGTADGTVSGIRYAHATLLGIHAASISLFTHTYAGYTGLAFDVGVSDTSTPGRTSTLVMSADGKPANARVGTRPVDTVVKRYGQSVTHVVVSFGHAGLITLAADPNGLQGIEDLVIANPTLLR